jgi:hypothetical protein
MGMTNRVIPAQGEERGASYTLIRLDGDASRKFQSLKQQFSASPGAPTNGGNRLNIPDIALKGVHMHVLLACAAAPQTVSAFGPIAQRIRGAEA